MAGIAGLRLDRSLALLAYAPPLAGFLFMAAFFGATLRRGKVPLISRVAQREHPQLPPELATYTRRLTAVWVGTFLAMAGVCAALALAVPFPEWSRWTHGLALVVPITLFLGEYLLRRQRFSRYAHASPLRLTMNILDVMREAATGTHPRSLPLLGFRSFDEPFLLDAPGTISVGRFLGQAKALAADLPPGTHVVNLCDGRHAFLVAFAAALMRGRVSLLPSGHARGDWQRLVAAYPGATLLSDSMPSGAKDAFRDVTSYLALEDVSGEMPHVEASAPAAILFTSGSTGAPVAHTKTWGQLWSGARTWGEALGWGNARGLVVLGSVAPQHMFGLEATVMLPLRSGVPMHAHRPLLPSDVEAALASTSLSTWWMATPLHLRACLASDFVPRGLAGIVSSTMSLPAAAARDAEARWGVAVHEIYGSTETGAVALRRPAEHEAWSPLPDIRLEPGEAGVRASGERIGEPVVLSDLMETLPDGRLLWRGRTSDLVKVGGKRESLSALDRRLQEIPGVVDGAFFVPDGVELARPVAFYVSTTVDPEAVTEALRSQVDSVFLPRPLYRVAALPRADNGKLPRPALAALHEACHSPERFTVHASHPSIEGHFPGDPIVPGALIIERVAQAIRARHPGRRAGVLASARFHAPLRPGEAAVVESKHEGNRITFEVRRGDALVASGTWRLD